MQEFLLLILRETDDKTTLSPQQMQQFLKEVQAYIASLTENGHFISAKPLVNEGKVISGTPGAFKDGPYNESKEVVIGYYHLFATDLGQALALAKGNPQFAYAKNVKIEVRPIKPSIEC